MKFLVLTAVSAMVLVGCSGGSGGGAIGDNPNLLPAGTVLKSANIQGSRGLMQVRESNGTLATNKAQKVSAANVQNETDKLLLIDQDGNYSAVQITVQLPDGGTATHTLSISNSKKLNANFVGLEFEYYTALEGTLGILNVNTGAIVNIQGGFDLDSVQVVHDEFRDSEMLYGIVPRNFQTGLGQFAEGILVRIDLADPNLEMHKVTNPNQQYANLAIISDLVPTASDAKGLDFITGPQNVNSVGRSFPRLPFYMSSNGWGIGIDVTTERPVYVQEGQVPTLCHNSDLGLRPLQQAGVGNNYSLGYMKSSDGNLWQIRVNDWDLSQDVDNGEYLLLVEPNPALANGACWNAHTAVQAVHTHSSSYFVNGKTQTNLPLNSVNHVKYAVEYELEDTTRYYIARNGYLSTIEDGNGFIDMRWNDKNLSAIPTQASLQALSDAGQLDSTDGTGAILVKGQHVYFSKNDVDGSPALWSIDLEGTGTPVLETKMPNEYQIRRVILVGGEVQILTTSPNTSCSRLAYSKSGSLRGCLQTPINAMSF